MSPVGARGPRSRDVFLRWHVEFYILGGLEVVEGGRALHVRGDKQKALLAMLLIDLGTVVSTDRLIEGLWGEGPPETAPNALQVYVSSLRKVLRRGTGRPETDVLVTRRHGYVLEVPPESVDSRRFQRLAADGARALQAGRAAESSPTLHQALGLWRGTALSDFAYEDFAQAEIRRLEDLRLTALEDRIEADLALGRQGPLIGELESLIAEHPLRERLRGHLMLALYRMGRQGDALEVYRDTRALLAADLGIDPSPALKRLEAAILSQDASLDAPRVSPPRPSEPVVPSGGVRPTEAPVARPDIPDLRQAGTSGKERKVVTVLFCDMVESTRAGDGADPEDIEARLEPYHQAVRRQLERYGGTFEKFEGDAVMGVFGAPTAHEDDPERAVRAAFGILDAIDALNEAVPGRDLRVRVGIETGLALVTLSARPEIGESFVKGDVVNTASRLQGVAPVGGIVVGEQTYRSTDRIFEFESLGPVEVKGKATPIQVWRALAARGRYGTDVVRSFATPLVGRDVDLALLRGAFEKTVRDRTMQLVTIVGELGVGKSRMVAELGALVDSSSYLVRWRQGRCLPYGDAITFWALGEILKAEAGILESDPPEMAGSKIDAVVADDRRDGPWLRQRLRPLAGLEAPPASREENFAAWRAFLESLAEARPSVFVFEDLHWADDALLAFLEYMAEWSDEVCMLLLCTARPELDERHRGFAGSARNASRINLAPLSDAETMQLISLLLASTVLPDGVQERISERSGGNPLYTEEFVRLLGDRRLQLGSEGVAVAAGVSAVSVPESVQALIAARLDTLSFDRKTLLQDAAVVGKVFWAGALSAIGDRDPGVVAKGLHELSRRDLIRPLRASSMEGEQEFSFKHVLIRDVAYGQIPRARRADRHRRTAEWIESVAGERVEDLSEILAYHYEAALHLARASGEQGEDLEAQALRFLLLAGGRALGLDTAKAEAHFARALALAPEGNPARPGLLVRWAEAARHAGRDAEAARSLREAIAAYRERGDRAETARAMVPLAHTLWNMGDPESLQVIGEAVDTLRSLPAGPDLVEAEAEATRLMCLSGDWTTAIERADQTIALAARLGLDVPAKALGYRGTSRCGLGDEGGLDDMRRALALAIEQGQGLEAAVLYNNLAVDIWPIEGPAGALVTLREGVDFARERGLKTLGLEVSMANPLLEVGAWDEVLRVAVLARGKAENLGDQLILTTVVGLEAFVLLARGRIEEASPLAERALELGRALGAVDYLPAPFSVGALAHLTTGDPEGARRLLAELEGLPEVSLTPTYAAALPQMVRTTIAVGDLDLGERLLSDLPATNALQRHSGVAARAELLEAMGRTQEALERYAEAADRWVRFGFVPEQAFALLGEGRCLLTLGRPTEAASALREARDIFGSLGTTPAIAETDELLEQATARMR